MSSNSHVNSKLNITPEAISQLLQNINQRVFKNLLNIEYSPGNKDSWGSHVWIIDYSKPLGPFRSLFKKICWIKSEKEFEVRHGNGEFESWFDKVLLNEVACEFNGEITDDTVSTKLVPPANGIPNQYDDLKLYLTDFIPQKFIKSILEYFPKEFHFNTNVN